MEFRNGNLYRHNGTGQTYRDTSIALSEYKKERKMNENVKLMVLKIQKVQHFQHEPTPNMQKSENVALSLSLCPLPSLQSSYVQKDTLLIFIYFNIHTLMS